MTLDLRAITNYLLYGTIALAPFQSEADDAVWSSDAEIASVVVPYVNANYERIVREQEERYGITFSSVPSYTFDSHPTVDANARYDPETGNITFYTAGAFDADALARVYTIFGITRRQVRQELDSTSRHELGHDYFFERADMFGTTAYWDNFSVDAYEHPDAETLAKRRIAEGVADYMGGAKKKDHIERYELVEPLLSANCKEGIDAIVQHPILPDEWDNLPVYIQRIQALNSL